MTANGVGFWGERIYLSPSSGSRFRLHATEDEWSSTAIVSSGGGGAGCCAIGSFVRASDRSIFLQLSDRGWTSLLSLTWVNGQVTSQTFDGAGIQALQRLVVGPVNGNRAFVAKVEDPGKVTVGLALPGGYVEQRVLVDAAGSARAWAVFDANTAAVVVTRGTDRSEVWTTLDGGVSWTLSLADSVGGIRNAAWMDRYVLWTVGDGGTVMRSGDQGTTWETIAVPTMKDLLAISGHSPDSVWVGGGSGTVLATGDAGLQWMDHSLADSLVTLLQVFDGVVYANASTPSVLLPSEMVNRLWKRSSALGMDDRSRSGPAHWVGLVPEGIRLLLDADERIGELVLYDRFGRLVPADVQGSSVGLEHLAAGLYLVRLRSNKRSETAKVLWAGVR